MMGGRCDVSGRRKTTKEWNSMAEIREKETDRKSFSSIMETGPLRECVTACVVACVRHRDTVGRSSCACCGARPLFRVQLNHEAA